MEKISLDFVDKAKIEINKAENIVIVVHKNPDGDALGSGLAMCQFLRSIGKHATLITPNKLPLYLNWMPNYNDIVVFEEKKEEGTEIIKSADMVIMLDFNHRSRLSEMGDVIIPLNIPKIMIDHHPFPESIAEIIYSRTSSSSTAELVYEFIDTAYGHSVINKEMAECLFLGIMTDTGSFSYNSSNPYTFEVVAKLLEKGIDKNYISDKVFNNYSEDRLKLMGFAIGTKMKVFPEFGTAYIYLTEKELKEHNFVTGDTEGFVNYPLSIKGVVFTALFIENDKFTKCSFRSKGSFPANLVAKEHFGGGGHTNAAGGENKAPIIETIAKFESIIPNYQKYLEI